MPRLCERLAQAHKQSNSFPASTGQDSCRRAVRIVDIDQQALAEATFSRFGVPELLINNAGIAAGGLAWENTPSEWHQVIGVNLDGVVNGVRCFVPHMLKAAKESGDFEAHIVNVASMAGLQCMPLMSLYNASKFAVLGFTETLYHDLALLTDRVNVSVVCPGMVPTGISRSERHAPAATLAPTPSQQLAGMMTDQGMALSRVSAAEVAQQTMAAVMESRFYVFTHPQDMRNVSVRAADQLAGRNPTDPFEKMPGVTAYLKKSLNAG